MTRPVRLFGRDQTPGIPGVSWGAEWAMLAATYPLQILLVTFASGAVLLTPLG